MDRIFVSLFHTSPSISLIHDHFMKNDALEIARVLGRQLTHHHHHLTCLNRPSHSTAM